ncbi:hypothetical protein SLH49_05165 [Cognatiyoonia sp. IB215446]|uniref:hypothetical protein n=1 Tax=Cognatiyoonia sp. IB215446 TaxID=3097355 RepID=UPI002A0B5BF4|nr:hypothetical protein [Cognatiyoonia sp. IB215446]MDX8347371.1 hypothetical protein [Cognatiyoonia sp. IB215446]
MFGKKRNDDEYLLVKNEKKSSFGDRLVYAVMAAVAYTFAFTVGDPLLGFILCVFGISSTYLVFFPE